MARDPIGRLLDPPTSELPEEALSAIEGRMRRAYRRPAPQRVATWTVLTVAAAAVAGAIAVSARPTTGPAANPDGSSAPTEPDSPAPATSPVALAGMVKPQFFTADLEHGIGAEWSTDEGEVSTFPIGPLERRYVALPDGSALTMLGPNGDHLSPANAALEPLCTNLDLVRVDGANQTLVDPALKGARAFDVSKAGTVFAVRAVCPTGARYGELGTGWELVSHRPGDPNQSPQVIARENAGELPDAAPDPHPSNMPVDLVISDDGKWIFAKIWDGRISDTQRRYRWDVRRNDGGTAPLDLSGGDGCVVRSQPFAFDAQHLVVACTLPFPTNGAGIRVSLVGPSGDGAPWVAEYPTDLAPDEVVMSVDSSFGADPTSPTVLLSWSTAGSWKSTIVGPARPTDETPLDVPGPAAWWLAELGAQELIDHGDAASPTEPSTELASTPFGDETPRAKFCTPAPDGILKELDEPWTILMDLGSGECGIVAAEPGNPLQRVNLHSDGDLATHVTVGVTTGWVGSFGLQAYELPATAGSPEVCRLGEIASADPAYISPDWGIQGCVDGWALLFHWGPAVTQTAHRIVRWDGLTWTTYRQFDENDQGLCDEGDPLLPAGLTRNACTMNFDITTGRLGNDLELGVSTVDDALREFRLAFGHPTADSGMVTYPPLPGPEGSNCLRGETIRVLQWGDLELGFDADGKLFTWSLGQRSGDSFDSIIPPGDPSTTPFLYASYGPWIGWTRDAFIRSFADDALGIGRLQLSGDGTEIGPRPGARTDSNGQSAASQARTTSFRSS